MPDCKKCNGGGFVYPIINQECSFCYNHPQSKNTCYECSGKGWKKQVISSVCFECDGTGKK